MRSALRAKSDHQFVYKPWPKLASRTGPKREIQGYDRASFRRGRGQGGPVEIKLSTLELRWSYCVKYIQASRSHVDFNRDFACLFVFDYPRNIPSHEIKYYLKEVFQRLYKENIKFYH